MKTINCAECKIEYSYEPPTKYPDKRKYCANCSEKKKASFEGAEVEPVLSPQTGKPYTDQPLSAKDQYYNEDTGKPKDKQEYEIGLRRCRSNALANTIEFGNWNGTAGKAFWFMVKHFEDYITEGDMPTGETG